MPEEEMRSRSIAGSSGAEGLCVVCLRPVEPSGQCVYCLLQLALDPAAAGSPEDQSSLSDSSSKHTTRFEHYQLVTHSDGSPCELGRGGMGVTYKAFDENLHCYVAVKVIHGALLQDREVRERFMREARQAAQLRHPNVASILHLGIKSGACFYAMELIEGESVEQLVQRAGALNPDSLWTSPVKLQVRWLPRRNSGSSIGTSNRRM